MPDIDISYFWSAGIFVNLALLFYVLGFLARNELWLRGLLLIGTAFYIIYYYYAAETPLWDAIFVSGVLGAANLFMILVILIERTTLFMSVDQVQLYQSFATLSPGQFRTVIRRAERIRLEEQRSLTLSGVVSSKLTFVISGDISIVRGDLSARAELPTFIGEIGFLLNRPASAEVVAEKGTEYLSWEATEIRALMIKKPEFSNAMVALFNFDLAEKVSRSMPHPSP